MSDLPPLDRTPFPTKKEINPFNDLDGQMAQKHFYGKSQSEAAKLFFEYSTYYEDDLMWMGDKAFVFYFPSLEPYLLSQESEDDSDIISHLVGTIEQRMKFQPLSIKGCLAHILRMLTYVSENMKKFNAAPDIYGDLDGRLNNLIEEIQSMSRSQS